MLTESKIITLPSYKTAWSFAHTHKSIFRWRDSKINHYFSYENLVGESWGKYFNFKKLKDLQLSHLPIAHSTNNIKAQLIPNSKTHKYFSFCLRRVMEYKTYYPIKYLGMFCLNELSNLWGNVVNLHSKISTSGHTYF